MEFIDTPLGMEYKLIRRTNAARFFTYRATIITERESIEALSVISVDWIRDYREAAADEILVEVVVPWGTYINRILPFKENLKVLLIRQASGSPSYPDDIPFDSEIGGPAGGIGQMFNAFLEIGDESEQMGLRPEVADEAASNLTSLRTITLQLQEEAFTILRSQMVGGVFRDSVPMDILMNLLVKNSAELDLDKAAGVAGYNVVPPNNTTPRTNVVIPHGLPLVSLAQTLQQDHGGIYNAGIGCYYQKGYWWVWPLYNHRRLDEVRETALFIIPPTERLKGIERTWRIQDFQLIAMITGGVQRTDPSEILQLNEGNGARFVNTERLIEGFFERKDNKATAQRSFNATEYEPIQRRSRGMNRVSANMTHSNTFQEASRLTQRNGAFFSLNWENSNPDQITPGLQCEVAFFIKGDAVYVKGVVVHAHAYSALSGTGLHQTVHQITTQVVVMVDRHSPEYARVVGSS